MLLHLSSRLIKLNMALLYVPACSCAGGVTHRQKNAEEQADMDNNGLKATFNGGVAGEDFCPADSPSSEKSLEASARRRFTPRLLCSFKEAVKPQNAPSREDVEHDSVMRDA